MYIHILSIRIASKMRGLTSCGIFSAKWFEYPVVPMTGRDSVPRELSWRGKPWIIASSSWKPLVSLNLRPVIEIPFCGRDSVPLMDCVSVESRWRTENCPEIEAEKRNNGRVHRSCSLILSYRLLAYHHLAENHFESDDGKRDPMFVR